MPCHITEGKIAAIPHSKDFSTTGKMIPSDSRPQDELMGVLLGHWQSLLRIASLSHQDHPSRLLPSVQPPPMAQNQHFLIKMECAPVVTSQTMHLLTN